jgi:uncharacterized protein YndB with AHSA1/START domain
VSTPDSAVSYCLERIGQRSPTWKTLIISAEKTSSLPAEQLWNAWTDLASWPDWSPIHTATSWTGPPSFAVGATFDQTLSLGFPIGKTVGHVRIDDVEPARQVSWSTGEGGFRSCHLWRFTPQLDGGTVITNTEVFAGVMAAILRPLVKSRWNKQFAQALDGLQTRASGSAAT